LVQQLRVSRRTDAFFPTVLLAGALFSALECLDLALTGAIRFALPGRQWSGLIAAHLALGVCACLVVGILFEVGSRLAAPALGRWTARPDRITAAVMFALLGPVWIMACLTGFPRGQLVAIALGLAALGGAVWGAGEPLPWRGSRVSRRGWRAAAWLAVALSAHLFNARWNAKIYFPLHVAATLAALTAMVFGAGHLCRLARESAGGRPRLAPALVAVALLVAVSMGLVRASNDVRHVLFTRAYDGKTLLYVARKLSRSSGPAAAHRAAVVVPAPAAIPRLVDRVLLITIDTVRADHLPTYGYGRDTAPAIARLARQATTFDWAWAAGGNTSLALAAVFGDARGAGSMTGLLAHGGIARHAVLRPLYLRLAGGFDQVKVVRAGAEDGEVADDAAAEIAAGRFDGLLWVHFDDPHRPYLPHPGSNFGARQMDLYDGEIHAADRAVGRLLAALDASPAGARTAVVLLADHGEEFGDHGGEAHGWDVYNELLHVPLLVRLPGGAPRRVAANVSQHDLAPTIAALFGLGTAGGRSLVPALLGGALEEGPVLTGPLSSFDVGALMWRRWKLAFCLFNRSRALYDLEADPGETLNLFEARPAEAAAMEQRLQALLAETPR
jgi:hypothetical protein